MGLVSELDEPVTGTGPRNNTYIDGKKRKVHPLPVIRFYISRHNTKNLSK